MGAPCRRTSTSRIRWRARTAGTSAQPGWAVGAQAPIENPSVSPNGPGLLRDNRGVQTSKFPSVQALDQLLDGLGVLITSVVNADRS